MASSRLDNYSLKLETLKGNRAKYATEIKKLTLWMHRHQNEALTDASKQRLVTILADSTQVLEGEAADLLQMYLSLPEGKLTTSKGKTRALKWLGSLDDENEQNKYKREGGAWEGVVGTVLDLSDKNVLTLEMDDATVIEVTCPQHLVEGLKTDFEAYLSDEQRGAIRVAVQSDNVVIKVL
jgi:hypothetical protein